MAGDWIPVTVELPKKREVFMIAERTGLERRYVVGTLVEFWLWLQSESVDGAVRGVTLKQLCEIVPGTAPEFWRAVVEVGWLQESGGGLRIPNARWIGDGAKARLLNARRQARFRAGHRESNGKNGATDDAASHAMAEYFQAAILRNTPDAKMPAHLDQWAKAFRLMRDADHRHPDEVRRVIDWATANSFWRSNILSAYKLREKYDTLKGQMQRGRQATNADGLVV